MHHITCYLNNACLVHHITGFLAYRTGIYADFTHAGKTGLAFPHSRRVTLRLGDVTFRYVTSYNCYVIHHSYASVKNSYVIGCRLLSGKRLYLYNIQEKSSIMCLSSGWKIRPSGICPMGRYPRDGFPYPELKHMTEIITLIQLVNNWKHIHE